MTYHNAIKLQVHFFFEKLDGLYLGFQRWETDFETYFFSVNKIKTHKPKNMFDQKLSSTAWTLIILDGALGFLGQNCSSLRKGRFYSCPNVSDKGILSLAQGCHKLDEIDLSWCNRVSDQGTDKCIKNIYIKYILWEPYKTYIIKVTLYTVHFWMTVIINPRTAILWENQNDTSLFKINKYLRIMIFLLKVVR